MVYPSYHDETQKTIVNNIVIPANQDGAADLKTELDALFNHPNTGPFICSQLIQRLVTSNPSPAYVYRVAQVFDNDGTGTRGNLAAVIKAILLDYEARSLVLSADTGYGKLKEPLLRMTAIYRAFNASSQEGRFAIFYRPEQPRPGRAALPDRVQLLRPRLRPAGRRSRAPGFMRRSSRSRRQAPRSACPITSIRPSTRRARRRPSTIVLNLSSLSANSANPAAMVATLNQLLCANSMSAADPAADRIHPFLRYPPRRLPMPWPSLPSTLPPRRPTRPYNDELPQRPLPPQIHRPRLRRRRRHRNALGARAA